MKQDFHLKISAAFLFACLLPVILQAQKKVPTAKKIKSEPENNRFIFIKENKGTFVYDKNKKETFCADYIKLENTWASFNNDLLLLPR